MRTRRLFPLSLCVASVSLSSAQSALEAPASGMIESVREVPVESVDAGIPGLFEHALGSGDEVAVRLDDGQLITVVQNEALRFEPGQRVVVFTAKSGARVEPASMKLTFD